MSAGNGITRRGFLKVLGIGAATVAAGNLIHLREVDAAIGPRDWITDHGDFLVVKVPDFKSFAKEVLNKPIVLILGEQSSFEDCEVDGFVNLYGSSAGRFTGCIVDSRKYSIDTHRAAIDIKSGKSMLIEGCRIYADSVGVTVNVAPFPIVRSQL